MQGIQEFVGARDACFSSLFVIARSALLWALKSSALLREWLLLVTLMGLIRKWSFNAITALSFMSTARVE